MPLVASTVGVWRESRLLTAYSATQCQTVGSQVVSSSWMGCIGHFLQQNPQDHHHSLLHVCFHESVKYVSYEE